jgi:hypothetical protein
VTSTLIDVRGVRLMSLVESVGVTVEMPYAALRGPRALRAAAVGTQVIDCLVEAVVARARPPRAGPSPSARARAASALGTT